MKKSFWIGLLIAAGCFVLLWFFFNRPLPDWPKTASWAIKNPEQTALGKMLQPFAAENPGKSTFRLLKSGLDAFAARALLIEEAEQSLDLQYYIYHGDDTGRLLTDRLIAAADRGVRVRLLVDDLRSFGYEEASLDLNTHPNIEVRFFNPFRYRGPLSKWVNFLFEFGRMNSRQHNKVFIADNIAAIVGGRNIGDEYFEGKPELSFEDLDILFLGPLAQEASKSFDAYWNSPLAAPADALFGKDKTGNPDRIRKDLQAHREAMANSVYVQRLAKTPLIQDVFARNIQGVWAEGVFVADPPDKPLKTEEERAQIRLGSQLKPIVDAAQEELLVSTPYFVPQDTGVEYFGELKEKGLDVKVLTNSLLSNDVMVVHSGYAKYRKPLLEKGVRLFELKPSGVVRQIKGIKKLTESSASSLHAKTFVLDGRVLFVGSMNLDPRAVDKNTESGIVVKSPELSSEVTKKIQVLSLPINSYQVMLRKDYEPGVSEKEGKDLIWVTRENGQIKTYDKDPGSTWWDRTLVAFFGLLPIEGQL